MRILEATIAVLIVSGVLVVVYSKQVDRGIDPVQYFNSLQNEILDDIAIRSDLRLAVLNVEVIGGMAVDDDTDGNFTIVNDFVATKAPEFTEYSISVCPLGSETDHCMLDGNLVGQTRDKELFVEDLIISADLGDGSNAIYEPKKLRLFMWEKY